ncbi:MAG: NPCBM/NEW2 domain-containing protein, partial [Phycisphaerae bacterium]|nr:NPCBM/NEW2 domain-containing protein [Phycisphaerae bacterium]
MKPSSALLIPALLLLACQTAHADRPRTSHRRPSAPELASALRQAHDWAARAFAKPIAQPDPVGTIQVLAKRNLVILNRTGWDTPITLGRKQYERGIYMDTPASIRVSLPRPAKHLTAQIGIDNNADTKKSPTKGSARFHVTAGGKKVYASPVLRMPDGPTPIRVPLGGAREIVLTVDDAGDGISHDQCDWADPTVTLENDSTLSLGDLPLIGSPPRRLAIPFSFTYDGKPSDSLLDAWEFETKTQPDHNEHTDIVSYKDPKTGLLVECHVKTFPDDAAVDWVCYLANTGPVDTPVIEHFMPLDTDRLRLGGPPDAPITLRWSNGDRHAQRKPTPASYMPYDEALQRGKPRAFAAHMTHEHLPFFNLQTGPDGGWIVAVGWTGGWRAEFLHDDDGRVIARAGMKKTHFRLSPGQRVRTPRISLLRWAGDELTHGHNQFRKLMLDHYVPRLDGKPAEPPVAASDVAGLWIRAKKQGLGQPNERLNEQSELATIDRLADIGADVYWMDAYWFPQPWWSNYGNWFARPKDFPNGLRPLADAAHAKGLKFILWFAIQKAHADTQLAKQHPEIFYDAQKGGLLKLGEPKARRIITDWLCERINEWGVDVYREDIVSDLPPEKDPDRLGVPEMLHVDGFNTFWSDLRKRNPGLLIDNCCGGGCKTNLDTCCLSYVLWRSDLNDIGEGLKGPDYYPYMATGDQVHVTGLSLYFPMHAGPTWDVNPYSFRSAMTTGIVIYEDLQRPDFPWPQAKRAIAELKSLRPLFLGDLYPLLELTASADDNYAF